MMEIERPKIEMANLSPDGRYGKFVVEPLERGFGTTLGNSLRRVLLSSLPGVAVTSVKIDGVVHEFSVIEGVREDVTEIVLNLKGIAAKIYGDGPKTVRVEAVGPCEVTAGTIKQGDDLEILNPEWHIATLGDGAKLVMELTFDTAEDVKKNNSQAIVDSVSVDGDIYGVPFTTNTWFMYYDKSAFTEDEVKNLDTMIAKDKISFPITNSWYIASFYVANGCTLFGEDGTDEAAGVDFEGDKAKAVTDYLVDLVNNPNFVSDADGSGLSGLRDGSVKAMFSGSWDASAVKEALGDNYGVVQLPTITINGEEKQMKSFSGSKAIGVNPNCEYPQVAVALARYLGSADAQKAHYEMRNVVPCNEELLSQITDDALVTAQNDTFNNTSIIQPFVKNMSNYWTPAENFGKSLVNGEVTHDNAAEMTEKLNTSMNTSAVE